MEEEGREALGTKMCFQESSTDRSNPGSHSLERTPEWHRERAGDGNTARESAWWLLTDKASGLSPVSVRAGWLTAKGTGSGQGRMPGQSGWQTLSCLWQQFKLLRLQEGNWHLERARTKGFPLQLSARGTEFWRIIRKNHCLFSPRP